MTPYPPQSTVSTTSKDTSNIWERERGGGYSSRIQRFHYSMRDHGYLHPPRPGLPHHCEGNWLPAKRSKGKQRKAKQSATNRNGRENLACTPNFARNYLDNKAREQANKEQEHGTKSSEEK